MTILKGLFINSNKGIVDETLIDILIGVCMHLYAEGAFACGSHFHVFLPLKLIPIYQEIKN